MYAFIWSVSVADGNGQDDSLHLTHQYTFKRLPGRIWLQLLTRKPACMWPRADGSYKRLAHSLRSFLWAVTSLSFYFPPFALRRTRSASSSSPCPISRACFVSRVSKIRFAVSLNDEVTWSTQLRHLHSAQWTLPTLVPCHSKGHSIKLCPISTAPCPLCPLLPTLGLSWDILTSLFHCLDIQCD